MILKQLRWQCKRRMFVDVCTHNKRRWDHWDFWSWQMSGEGQIPNTKTQRETERGLSKRGHSLSLRSPAGPNAPLHHRKQTEREKERKRERGGRDGEIPPGFVKDCGHSQLHLHWKNWLYAANVKFICGKCVALHWYDELAANLWHS